MAKSNKKGSEANEIAKQIEAIAEKRAREMSEDNESIKEALQYIVHTIHGSMLEAKALHEDFQIAGLSFSAIEAEGAYRSLLTLWNSITAYAVECDSEGNILKIIT